MFTCQRVSIVVLACLLACGVVRAQAPEPACLAQVDFTAGAPAGGIATVLVNVVRNGQDADSVVFAQPGVSRLIGGFRLKEVPADAVLELRHLSAGSADARTEGSSPVRITINGFVLAEALDPGSHGFVRDRLHVHKYLKKGANTFEIRLGAAETTYWLRSVAILGTPVAPALDVPVPEQPLLAVMPAERIPKEGRFAYAVCVSRETMEDEAWRAAANALVARHAAALVLYSTGVPEQVLPLLRSIDPQYVGFVARPEEAGRDFVAALHRLSRQVDDDPYGDFLWGIVTGYDAGDALRIAQGGPPLSVRRVVGGTGLDLTNFQSGVAFFETRQGRMRSREPRGEVLDGACPPDATAEIVKALNAGDAQLFVTSGHASERDWQIGFSFKGGQIRCREGRLLGIDAGGGIHPIDSSNPKVYLAPGNCLIGHIPDREAIALAWMHSGGVDQFVGYTVSTWHGFMGWTVLHYWVESQQGMTLAEAFFAASQANVAELQTRFPKTAGVTINEFGIESDPFLLDSLAERYGITDQENLGLLWDRDTLAFYGDPAFEARVVPGRVPPYAASLESEPLSEGRVRCRLSVTAAEDGELVRPVFLRLPERLRDLEVPSDSGLVVPGDFLLWKPGVALKKGETRSVTFTGATVAER